MSVSLRVTGSWAELVADGTVAIPATPQAGDRMYLFARWKDFSVTATVANWTAVPGTPFADGSVSAGNGTGSVKVGCWYRDWQPGDSDPTIDFSASPDNASAVIMVMQKGADDVWDTPVARTAAMTSWTTTSQSVSASATVTVPSSGVVMGLIGIRDDTSVMTRPTNGIDDGAAAVTWNGNYVESPATHHSTTTGFDGAADLGYRLVTTGAAGVTLRMTGTISAAETGAALWVVQGVSVVVTPGVASLVASAFAPLLKLLLTPAAIALTTTSFAPQLREVVTPAPASLGTTTFAPSLQTRVTPAAASLTATTFAPQLREATTPANATLSVTTFAPSLRIQLTPSAASLSLSAFAPTVSTHTIIEVPTANLTITTSRPHIKPYKIIFIDPGGDAVQTIGHFNVEPAGSEGDVSFDSTEWVVGVGSYKFDSGVSGVDAYARVPGVLGGSRRVSAYFWYDSLPDVVESAEQFVLDATEYSGGGLTGVGGGTLAGDEGVYATATPAQNGGQGSIFGSLGLNIPQDATIVSVKIIYERKYDVNTSIGISRVKWRVNGEEGPNHDNTDMPLTDTVVEVDVTGDMFWEVRHLTGAAFEVIAEARRGDSAVEHTQSWDYVKVVVEYAPATTIMALYEGADIAGSLVLVPKGDYGVLRFTEGLSLEFTKFSYDGITKLLPDVKNRISFSYVVHGPNDLDIKVYVNGIEELFIENAATNNWPGSEDDLYYGWVHTPGVNHVCWFDQLFIDEGDDLTDCGNMLSTAKLPATVNENNWNTTGGTGAVNERPLSETNFRQETRAIQFRQTYTLEADDEGDVDISGESLIGYMGWVWGRRGSGTNEDIAMLLNGVQTQLLQGVAATNITTTPKLIYLTEISGTYPSNAAGIGMASNNETADTFMYECGVVMAYQGPPNPDILLERQEVANETLDTIIDDLRADPPDSYEVCCKVEEFDGTATIDVYSIDAEGNAPQFQGTMSSSGGTGRMRVTPGIEIQVVVTVVGVTMMQVYRRINFE